MHSDRRLLKDTRSLVGDVFKPPLLHYAWKKAGLETPRHPAQQSTSASFSAANLQALLSRDSGQLPGTKVIATIGPASESVEVLSDLLRAGLRCVRLDISCSRGALEAASRETGITCCVIVDTSGPEVFVLHDGPLSLVPNERILLVPKPAGVPPHRATSAASSSSSSSAAAAPAQGGGDTAAPPQPTTNDDSDDEQQSSNLPARVKEVLVSDPDFHRRLRPGDQVFANLYLSAGCETDSCVTLEVVGIDAAGRVECAAKVGGALKLDGVVTLFHVSSTSSSSSSSQGAAAAAAAEEDGGGCLRRTVLSDEDKALLEAFAAKKLEIDYLAVSFAECRADIDEARAFLDRLGGHMHDTQILAKIETRRGLHSFQEIMNVSFGLLMSRGNLGMDVPLEKLVRLQKEVVWHCNALGKPVYITRVMDSMTFSPRPTRAEATDIANACLDGVDGFLLGAETFRGCFPLAALQAVLATSREAEKVFDYDRFLEKLTVTSGEGDDLSTHLTADMDDILSQNQLSRADSMAMAASRMARKVGARLLIVFTKSGHQALLMSKWRPCVPILAIFVPRLETSGVTWTIRGKSEARRALLLRGVTPVLANPQYGWSEDSMLRSAVELAEEGMMISDQDVLIVTHNLKGDITTSVVIAGEGYCSHGQGFISGGASEVCLTRHDHVAHDKDGGGGHHQMAFSRPTQQQPERPLLATPQMPRVQARPREEILGGFAGAVGGALLPSAPPTVHHNSLHPHGPHGEEEDGDYSPLSPPRRKVVPRTYLNNGGGNGGGANNGAGLSSGGGGGGNSGGATSSSEEPSRAAAASSGAGA